MWSDRLRYLIQFQNPDTDVYHYCLALNHITRFSFVDRQLNKQSYQFASRIESRRQTLKLQNLWSIESHPMTYWMLNYKVVLNVSLERVQTYRHHQRPAPMYRFQYRLIAELH